MGDGNGAEAAGERTRRRIVIAAAAALRRHGIEGIGVRELMKQAGMTPGSFYFHFRDKQALVAEASHEAFATCTEWLFREVDAAPAGERLATLVELYLSPQHRATAEIGCTMAALGAEIARGDRRLRRSFVEASEQMIERAARHVAGRDATRRQGEARVLVSAMAGVLIAARVQPDAAAAERLLSDARARFGDLARALERGGVGPTSRPPD